MKICSVGAVLFHAEGRADERTDMMKLFVALRNFANVHSVFLRFLVLEQMMMMFTYSINRPYFITPTECAYELNFSIYFRLTSVMYRT
jgi:hypothetical protein